MSVFSHLYCSTTITFASQNSADLDMGRRPELKSAELCDANVTVIEITSIFCLKPLKQVGQLLAARPIWMINKSRAFRPASPAPNNAQSYIPTGTCPSGTLESDPIMRCSGGSYTRESDVENLDRKFLTCRAEGKSQESDPGRCPLSL